MRVLVTGGTGRLGRALVPLLVAGGHRVRIMTRTPREPPAGAEVVRADLATGLGLGDGVTGVDTVVHLASAPYRGRQTVRVDVDGTRRLVEAARASGASHLVYTSIVGVDRVPWAYFRRKVAAEQIVRGGGLGWSIVRATQFHEFVDAALTMAARLPVMITDPRIPGQPVDARDVADHLMNRVAAGPSATIEDFGGPEVLTFEELVRAWLTARGVRRPLLTVRIPGRLGRAFRAGYMTTPERALGRITWEQYLAERHLPPGLASGT
ncbi:MAG TPA: NAD(P)H-binding protein [Micromonosporaceae bacterium]|jgi:uncharacterized protein YbjT (DUF2867 family)